MSMNEEKSMSGSTESKASAGSIAKFFQSNGKGDVLADAFNGSNGAESRTDGESSNGELVRLVLDSTAEGLYGIDLEGNCTFANTACAKMLGFDDPSELLGKQMHELVHHTRPDGTPYPVEECHIYRAFRERKGTHVDDEIMFCSDGVAFPVEYWSYPVERNGEQVGCVVTFMDITERRDAEAQKREADDLVRLLLDSTAEGIYGIDLEGNCTFANPASAKLLGVEDASELLGKQMHNLVHHTRADGSNYPVEECQLYQALRDRKGTHVDDELMYCVNGNIFPAEYWSYPVERNGELVGCVVTFMDISARIEAEVEKSKADELIRLLMDSTGEGIYGVDMDGNCIFTNTACARILGFESTDELMGEHMHNLVHNTRPNGEPYPEEECQIYEALSHRQGAQVDDEIMLNADGGQFPAEYWSYPLERDGEVVGCVVTFVDITNRRLTEEEMRQTEKIAAIGKLAAGLAHELNNPAAAATRASSQLVGALGDLNSATIALSRSGIVDEIWDSVAVQSKEFEERTANATELSAMDASDREYEIATSRKRGTWHRFSFRPDSKPTSWIR